MSADQPPGLTLLGQCGLGPSLRLVSDRVASWEWESCPRLAQRPRYRQRGLAPWRPIDAKPLPRISGETDGEAAN
jgi:hypothetical protein